MDLQLKIRDFSLRKWDWNSNSWRAAGWILAALNLLSSPAKVREGFLAALDPCECGMCTFLKRWQSIFLPLPCSCRASFSFPFTEDKFSFISRKQNYFDVYIKYNNNITLPLKSRQVWFKFVSNELVRKRDNLDKRSSLSRTSPGNFVFWAPFLSRLSISPTACSSFNLHAEQLLSTKVCLHQSSQKCKQNRSSGIMNEVLIRKWQPRVVIMKGWIVLAWKGDSYLQLILLSGQPETCRIPG